MPWSGWIIIGVFACLAGWAWYEMAYPKELRDYIKRLRDENVGR